MSFVQVFMGRFADEVQSQNVLSGQKPWWFSGFGYLDENVAQLFGNICLAKVAEVFYTGW